MYAHKGYIVVLSLLLCVYMCVCDMLVTDFGSYLFLTSKSVILYSPCTVNGLKNPCGEVFVG